jgi:hypothetical protein
MKDFFVLESVNLGIYPPPSDPNSHKLQYIDYRICDLCEINGKVYGSIYMLLFF